MVGIPSICIQWTSLDMAKCPKILDLGNDNLLLDIILDLTKALLDARQR